MTGFSSAYSDVRRMKQARRGFRACFGRSFYAGFIGLQRKERYKIHDTGGSDSTRWLALGEKSFRAKQLYDWMHVKLAEGFDDMTSLSIAAEAEA